MAVPARNSLRHVLWQQVQGGGAHGPALSSGGLGCPLPGRARTSLRCLWASSEELELAQPWERAKASHSIRAKFLRADPHSPAQEASSYQSRPSPGFLPPHPLLCQPNAARIPGAGHGLTQAQKETVYWKLFSHHSVDSFAVLGPGMGPGWESLMTLGGSDMGVPTPGAQLRTLLRVPDVVLME